MDDEWIICWLKGIKDKYIHGGDEAFDNTRRSAIDRAIERIKEIPKWISVDEKKPKSMANKVIVYVEHEDLVPQIGYGHYEKFEGKELWYNLETNEPFSKHGYTVTHWMPMPRSPEGEILILN